MSAFARKIFLLQHCFVSLRRFDSIAHPKFQDAKLSGNSGLLFFTTGVLNCKHFRNKRVHLWKLIATKQGMFMVTHHVTEGRIPLTCCQSNVFSPVCVHWLISFAVMLLAVRLKWRRSVVIGRFGSGQSINLLLDSDDDFRSVCRNVSHHYRQMSFSGLHSPGRSNYTFTDISEVRT